MPLTSSDRPGARKTDGEVTVRFLAGDADEVPAVVAGALDTGARIPFTAGWLRRVLEGVPDDTPVRVPAGSSEGPVVAMDYDTSPLTGPVVWLVVDDSDSDSAA